MLSRKGQIPHVQGFVVADCRRRQQGGDMKRVITALKPVLIAALLAALAASCAGRSESQAGDLLYEQGRYDEAVEMYEQALHKNPADGGYRRNLQAAKKGAAEDHFKKGDLNLKDLRLLDARAEFQSALRYDPQSRAAADALAETQALLEKITADKQAAQSLIEQKKWAEAAETLAPLTKYRADFPELAAMRAKALDAAFSAAMEEGMAAYRAGEFAKALSLFGGALELRPDDSGAKGMARASKNQIFALESCKDGSALLDAGDFRGAIRKYESALALVPGHAKAAEGLQAAREHGAKTLTAEGVKALEEKRYIDAIGKFDEAAALAPNYPGLAEARAKAARAVADVIFEQGRAREKADRLASAHLYYSMTRLLAPDYPGLDDRLAVTSRLIDSALAYDAALAFTGEADLQSKFVSDLKGRLSRIQILTASEQDAIKKLNPDYRPDGVLTVKVGPVSVERGIPQRARRSVRYVSDTRLVVNPEHESLRNDLDRYRARLEEAKLRVDDQGREVRRLRRLRDDARAEWMAASDDDPRKEEMRRRYVNLRDETTSAERRLEDLNREYDAWRYKISESEHRLSITPALVRENIYSTHYYDVVTNTITATGEAAYSVNDALAGEGLLADRADARLSGEDKVVEGFEPAGIRADPDELPSESDMRRNAGKELVRKAVDGVVRDIGRFPLRYLRMAEMAATAGKDADAADWSALYLFTCRALGLSKGMPRLAEVDETLKSQTGYSVLRDRYDLGALRELLPKQ